MISYRNKVLLVTATALGLAGTVHAEGIYGTAMIGASHQVGDSKPYGNNIAADQDFPGKFDTGDGAMGALGIGYAFNNQFRVEGRLSLHRADFDSQQFGTGARAGEEYVLNGDIKSTTLTIEGFYDIPVNDRFAPYVKAGVGVTRNRYSARLGGAGVAAFDSFDGTTDGYYDAYDDQTSTEFTWNVGFGGSLALNDQFTLFGEYQYVDFGDASTGQDAFTDGFRVNTSAHEILFGARADF
uniref:outer membrane protein n=1 Tax=Marinobacterium profundum TaxID=1714300 RepID=UPI00082BF082|nr:outer membrane beta-barrel protein [Marinobacterium profundum]